MSHAFLECDCPTSVPPGPPMAECQMLDPSVCHFPVDHGARRKQACGQPRAAHEPQSVLPPGSIGGSEVVDVDLQPEREVLRAWAMVEAEGDRPRLVPMSPSRWLAALSRLVGQRVRVVVLKGRRRSLPQNAYYWGPVLGDVMAGLQEQATEAGIGLPFRSKDDLHWYFKHLFLRQRGVLPWGEEIEINRSSARLTVEQFGDYLTQIMAWAAERRIYVRAPGEHVAA